MRNDYSKPREFECGNCEFKFKLKSTGKEKIMIQESRNNGEPLRQDVAEQIFCPKCGDDEVGTTVEQDMIDKAELKPLKKGNIVRGKISRDFGIVGQNNNSLIVTYFDGIVIITSPYDEVFEYVAKDMNEYIKQLQEKKYTKFKVGSRIKRKDGKYGLISKIDAELYTIIYFDGKIGYKATSIPELLKKYENTISLVTKKNNIIISEDKITISHNYENSI